MENTLPGTAAPTASRSAAKSGAVRARKPVLKFRMRITNGEAIAVGPGKIALLEAIDQTGSITAAAKSLEMSYRRAWMLLDELNRCLRKPAVDSAKGGQHGGGSALTDEGRQLIALYRRIETTAQASCSVDIKQLMKLLAR